MKTLKQAKIGETVKVVKLHGEGAIKRRIMDMGITRGTEIYIRKVAPLGDPIEVTVRGYELSLPQGGRRHDRDRITIFQVRKQGIGRQTLSRPFTRALATVEQELTAIGKHERLENKFSTKSL